jgi:hypothetical protein
MYLFEVNAIILSLIGFGRDYFVVSWLWTPATAAV